MLTGTRRAPTVVFIFPLTSKFVSICIDLQLCESIEKGPNRSVSRLQGTGFQPAWTATCDRTGLNSPVPDDKMRSSWLSGTARLRPLLDTWFKGCLPHKHETIQFNKEIDSRRILGITCGDCQVSIPTRPFGTQEENAPDSMLA